MEVYRRRGSAVAAEQFLGVVLSEDARDLLDQFLAGAFDEAVANADLFFQGGQFVPTGRRHTWRVTDDWPWTRPSAADRCRRGSLATAGPS